MDVYMYIYLTCRMVHLPDDLSSSKHVGNRGQQQSTLFRPIVRVIRRCTGFYLIKVQPACAPGN
jgi:hypothetical protein